MHYSAPLSQPHLTQPRNKQLTAHTELHVMGAACAPVPEHHETESRSLLNIAFLKAAFMTYFSENTTNLGNAAPNA